MEIKIGSKKYYEIYAMKMLAHFYDFSFEYAKVLNCEKPDIQLTDIGVEVTRAVFDEEAKANTIFNNIIKKNNDKSYVYEQIRKNHKHFQGECFCIAIEGKVDAITAFPYGYDFDKRTCRLIETINSKIDKYETYTNFKTMGLYVFAETSMFYKEEIEEIIKDIKYMKYDVLFIDCLDKLYIYENKILKECNISNKTRKKINQEVFNYSK